MKPGKHIAVFCGAAHGKNPQFLKATQELGKEIARVGATLVYGGGGTGLMGALADAVLGAGGKAIGVIPEKLVRAELAHRRLTELKIVGSMHERKAVMGELSDFFISLPGGIGTMDEFFEMWTWTQLGMQRKASALLNVAGFYDPLVTFFDRSLVAEGFVELNSRGTVLVEEDPKLLVERLLALEVPDVTRKLLNGKHEKV